jgi:hypothetical protein
MNGSMKWVLAAVLSIPVFLKAETPVTGTIPAESRITAVTVYADRARVTRSATVALPAGVSRIVFEKLPGWIDEGSVRVVPTPAAACKIADMQVLRTFLAQPADAEVRNLEEGVTEIQDQVAALDDELQPLEAQEQQITSVRAFASDKLPKDTAAREVKPEEYGAVVKYVGGALSDIAKAKRAIAKKKRLLLPELSVRERKLADLRQCMQLEQRTVIVTLAADVATKAELSLVYMLPGTTWEPSHELRTSRDGKTVEIASFAVVSQTTGENWDGADLAFSTQRPTSPARIPELEALIVGSSGQAIRIAGQNDSFDDAEKNWRAQNPVFNGTILSGENSYANSSFSQAGKLRISKSGYLDNVASQKLVQRKVATVFEKIQQKRGTTAQFAASGPQTVRTDGRQVRVPILASRINAMQKVMAAPELSLNAVRTVGLTNTCGQPLLPGRVSLFMDGALVGMTEMEFAGAGEEFSLFLGTEDSIKLSRTLDKKNSSLTWSGKRRKMQAVFLIEVENLAGQQATIQLADRIPVSDNDDVRISGVRIEPAAKPDSKGLLKWDVTLAPKEKRQYRIEYTVIYPPELPRRRIQVNAAEAPQVEGSAAAPQEDLHLQILNIESKF